jgi:hypothetical protein
MWKVAALSVGFFAPSLALACPGHDGGDATHASAPAHDCDPGACAKNADLVGGGCSYSTGMMAQRVLSEGKPWAFTGTLARSAAELDSHVAAPFTVGPDKVSVVANEVLERLTDAGAHGGRVSLEGRILEVEGVKYFVLTSFSALNS